MIAIILERTVFSRFINVSLRTDVPLSSYPTLLLQDNILCHRSYCCFCPSHLRADRFLCHTDRGAVPMNFWLAARRGNFCLRNLSIFFPIIDICAAFKKNIEAYVGSDPIMKGLSALAVPVSGCCPYGVESSLEKALCL